ncbi:hypothetical protein BUALT_Bualt12G0146000 [Buddleja alternifolia]|uniref:Uncharacterized protein n=1 Tax=Buddleja alternifolia TaxID=168488 RepID=A0AAV6WXN4_9LAMI|nr:hypothetical protein BUALT_Bualt12G0146000 [Buddleja alternifolia]
MRTLCNCIVSLAWRSPSGGTTDQYVSTGQVEPDLLGVSLAMLTEVAGDAKKVDREPSYVKMLAIVLRAMRKWCEKRLLDYHGKFHWGNVGVMEHVLPLVFSATRILEDDVPCYVSVQREKGEVGDELTRNNRVDHYIRSSLRNAFAKMLEHKKVNGTTKNTEAQEVSEVLIKLAKETEELATKERDIFNPVLKKWHPISAGVAAVTLHTCCGTLLKQYLTSKSSSINETILALFNLVVEDSVECKDGAKAIVREMVPYEADSLILRLLKQWIQDQLQMGKEHLQRAKKIKTWNPKSKTKPYAHLAGELVTFAKEVVENFIEIPINSYLPTLSPLTRCSPGSKIFKLWKRAACSVGIEDPSQRTSEEANHPRPSTSRGTQRLYIRLNTLHYIVPQLNALDKTLLISPKIIPSKSRFGYKKNPSTSYFEHSQSAIEVASQHVSEIAAYHLIFLDLNSVLYGSLYVGGVVKAGIRLALRTLKQNLTLLCRILTDRAQPMALKEVMKASFKAFLMVLLAGDSSRVFSRLDHAMIEEDFDSLKRVFFTCGKGLIVEDLVDMEAEVVEGVVALMGQSTEQLVENFSNVACGVGGVGRGRKQTMPPTIGRWSRSDPNTILRVLCCRNDPNANYFLKKTFHLAKRRLGIRII